MNCGKVGVCAVELEGKIYVIDGNNGYNRLRQCEVYDVQTRRGSLAKGILKNDMFFIRLILSNHLSPGVY